MWIGPLAYGKAAVTRILRWCMNHSGLSPNGREPRSGENLILKDGIPASICGNRQILRFHLEKKWTGHCSPRAKWGGVRNPDHIYRQRNSLCGSVCDPVASRSPRASMTRPVHVMTAWRLAKSRHPDLKSNSASVCDFNTCGSWHWNLYVQARTCEDESGDVGGQVPQPPRVSSVRYKLVCN